jgi:mediator of RNA polymerase II transcription subunit 18
MHELLLYGQVPRSRHDQVLKILAGVAAMQPRRILQRHIVYKPTREPDEPGLNMRRGGTQAVAVKQTKQTAAKDLNFSQLVQKLVEEDFGNRNNGSALMAGGQVGGESKWALEFHDTPDADDRGVLARLTQVTDITSGDPHAYMVADKNQ